MNTKAPQRLYADCGQIIEVPELGLELRVMLNDDGQPTVLIDTESMRPEYIYDDRTGLPGTAEPYTVRDDGARAEVIGPDDEVVSTHFQTPRSIARFDARNHANTLNEAWSGECGMPDVQVLMGPDAVLYDSEDHNPALRERRQGEKTDA